MIYQGEALSVQLLQDGIAELSFDGKGAINKLDRATLQSLEQAVTALEQTTGISGLMLASAKDAFIVGADITEFLELFELPEAELGDWLA
ncbi:fatty acid oxidation complex subunit alpha FadB, partial [Zobellella endophytica]